MELNEYQRLANQTDQQPGTVAFEDDPRSILVPLLGLAGEVGELLEVWPETPILPKPAFS